MENKKIKTENLYFWHFLTGVIYISLVAWIIFFLNANEMISKVSTFDFVLMSLAVFRLIRLVVNDTILDFVRDYFGKFEYDLGKSIFQLITCPWCVGIWAALFIGFIYFLTPLAWFFILILALAGVSSILQIISNSLIKFLNN